MIDLDSLLIGVVDNRGQIGLEHLAIHFAGMSYLAL
jgi:hypothetical protein